MNINDLSDETARKTFEKMCLNFISGIKSKGYDLKIDDIYRDSSNRWVCATTDQSDDRTYGLFFNDGKIEMCR